MNIDTFLRNIVSIVALKCNKKQLLGGSGQFGKNIVHLMVKNLVSRKTGTSDNRMILFALE